MMDYEVMNCEVCGADGPCPDCVKALDGFMRGANPGEGAESD